MRKETRLILEKYYTQEDLKKFIVFSKIIEKDYKNKEKQRIIWEYDKKLGGYGGYAAPLNPTINPFNRLEEYRNVFRSLQYARSDMYYCNRARHIIIDAALHVETLVKILVSKDKTVKFIYEKRELGKNIEQLYKEEKIDSNLYERLNNYRKILNLAKHDTDTHKANTFSPIDAIVFYFETRVIGIMLLKILRHHSVYRSYEINEEF